MASLFKIAGIGVVGGLLIYVAAIAWTLNSYRFKVTDPEDPAFKAENFRFEDYFLNKDVTFGQAKVFAFPPGTDRVFLEDILIKKNGARGYDSSDELKARPVTGAVYYIIYDYNPWWNIAYKLFGLMNGVMFEGAIFRIFVYYDDQNKVVKVE